METKMAETKMETVKLYNTKTEKMEVFKPIDDLKIGMSVCVSDARTAVVFDTLHRYLKHLGYEVKCVSNLRHFSDKLINQGSKCEKNLPIEDCLSHTRALQCLPTDDHQPNSVDEYIVYIIDMIKKIIAKDIGYVVDGDVFFSVDKSPNCCYPWMQELFKKLLLSGQQLDDGDPKKRNNPADFALWKATKPGEPNWKSPWGPGRPGCHIWCSAMSTHYLSPRFDILGGGAYLKSPHHEHVIAQTCAAFEDSGVAFLLHNEPVTNNNVEMGNSLNNSVTIENIMAKYHPLALRYFLMSAHYRSPLTYSVSHLESSSDALGFVYQTLKDLTEALPSLQAELSQDGGEYNQDDTAKEKIEKLKVHVRNHMSEDLNTVNIFNGDFEDMIQFTNNVLIQHKTWEKKRLMSMVVSLVEVKKAVEEVLEVLGLALTTGSYGNMVASILCTQPRRFAVVPVAKMVAKSRDSDLGGEIGYHIGHSKIHTQSSKILFKTAGLLLDEMLDKGLNALKYKVSGLLGVTSDLSAADTQIKPTVSEMRELLQIFVKTFRGKTLILEVQSSLTIGKLKTMIKEGISAKHQRLTEGGRHLRDHFTLADYHIQNQSTLFLMLSLKGGAEAEDPINLPIPNPEPEPLPNPEPEPLPNPLPYIDPNRIPVYIDLENAAIPNHVTSARELLVLVEKALHDIGIFQPFTVHVIVASHSQSRLPTPRYNYLLQIPNGIADRILVHSVYGVEVTFGQVSDTYIQARFDQLVEAREREIQASIGAGVTVAPGGTVVLFAEDKGYTPRLKRMRNLGITVLLGRVNMKAKQLYANFPVVDLEKLYAGEASWYTLYMRKKIPKFRKIPITVDKIRVHGVPLSTGTMRVLASLYEKGVAFDFIPVDIATALYQQPFLSLNPFNQTPTLEDGDLKLFGSRAITEYIAEEYNEIGNTLFPEAKAITKVWLDVEGQQFDPVAAKLVFERVFKVMFGMTADPAAVQALESKLTKVLDIYEDRLWKSEFLASDYFSLADLHHLPAIHYLMGTSSRLLFESRPKVRAWVEKITVRPAWAMVVDIPEQ